MEKEQVIALLNSSEGVSLEFKKSVEFPEAIARTICAFANTFGGCVVIGVEKQAGKALSAGVGDVDVVFQTLGAIVSQLQPKPYYEAREHAVNGKKLVVVKVDALPLSEVCFLKKTVFRRFG